MPEPVTAAEIRTRRLVVTDEHDEARIVAEVVRGVAELRAATGDPQTYVLLYAGPGSADDTSSIGIELFVGGDSVARIHAWTDGTRWRWQVSTEE